MKLSVCIATWSRKEKLKEIIELLENQSMPRDQYEIVVVDSKSPDGTNVLMQDICKEYENVVYIEDAKNILAVKRNVGIDNSTSDIIVFIDDDVYPGHRFVESHYLANKNNTDTFYCGQIRFPKELCKKSNYYRFRDQQHLNKDDVNRELPFNNIVVMNLSFRKEFIERVGKVDERFLGYGCEDIEFGYRVIKSGYKIKYLESAVAIHKEDSSDIVSYGKKLYKTGLYGTRVLQRVCPEAWSSLSSRRKKWIGAVASRKIVSEPLAAYLKLTDSNPKMYSYFLFKLYLYSCMNKGKRDQSKYPELDYSTITKGW